MHQLTTWRAAIIQIDRDDAVCDLALDGVILAHADPAIPMLVDHAVSEPPVAPARGRRGSERLRRRARRLAIKAAVAEVGEIEGAVVHGPRAAAVFVHARAHVERHRRDVGRIAVRAGAHHHVAALFLRAPFDPVDGVAVEAHVRQADGLRDDEVRGDRRLPGPVRRRFFGAR
jgi:hypothetical protein